MRCVVCGRFKSTFFLFRHAAPRNQHPRNRISSRRLREIDPRFGGLSAAAPTNLAEQFSNAISAWVLPGYPCNVLRHHDESQLPVDAQELTTGGDYRCQKRRMVCREHIQCQNLRLGNFTVAAAASKRHRQLNSALAHEFCHPLTHECRNGEGAIPSQRYLERGQRKQGTLLRRWGAVTSQ